MLENNYAEIKQRVALAAREAKRDFNEITILAVSKKISAETVRAAAQLGIKNFGENYVQEFLQKHEQLADLKLRWHFIGHLQSNKAKLVSSKCELIQSVDRVKIIEVLSKKVPDGEEPAPFTGAQKILIEVNLVNEKSKTGCSISELPLLIELAQQTRHIRLCGLMFMPPLGMSKSEQLKFFESARLLRDDHKKYLSGEHNLTDLSMGTSHDFEAAISQGSTIVRLGTTLFGAREN